MIKEIILEQNTYDDEALNTYLIQGYHYPTIIIDDSQVIVLNDTLALSLNEAKEMLMKHSYDSTQNYASIIFECFDMLFRITWYKRSGNYETIRIK